MERGLAEQYNQRTTYTIKKKKTTFLIKKMRVILLSFFAFIHILSSDAQ